MTLTQLKEAAERDAAEQVDAQRMMAGSYARLAVRAIGNRDYAGAQGYIILAAARIPEYASALRIIDAARAGAAKSRAKAAASRLNGKRGGRPPKEPDEDPPRPQ